MIFFLTLISASSLLPSPDGTIDSLTGLWSRKKWWHFASQASSSFHFSTGEIDIECGSEHSILFSQVDLTCYRWPSLNSCNSLKTVDVLRNVNHHDVIMVTSDWRDLNSVFPLSNVTHWVTLGHLSVSTFQPNLTVWVPPSWSPWLTWHWEVRWGSRLELCHILEEPECGSSSKTLTLTSGAEPQGQFVLATTPWPTAKCGSAQPLRKKEVGSGKPHMPCCHSGSSLVLPRQGTAS